MSASPTSGSASTARQSGVAAHAADSQLSLFDVSSPAASRELSATTAATSRTPRPQPSPAQQQPASGARWPESVVVHTDGACRGNPGPSSIGLHFIDSQGGDLDRVGERIGTQTNNYAEYTAVIRALEVAARHGVRRLTVRSDSELMVRQMQGVYKVKSEAIRPLFERVQQLQRQFAEVRFEHVRREFNAEADRLANLALDGRL
ncbi:MAG TPA: ribonuclease HI family protein [Pseudobdellovibrionaceae bacterium]|nr:ribonuclease HI family protein [Pseudobdellovibrionaceae bacterium]